MEVKNNQLTEVLWLVSTLGVNGTPYLRTKPPGESEYEGF